MMMTIGCNHGALVDNLVKFGSVYSHGYLIELVLISCNQGAHPTHWGGNHDSDTHQRWLGGEKKLFWGKLQLAGNTHVWSVGWGKPLEKKFDMFCFMVVVFFAGDDPGSTCVWWNVKTLMEFLSYYSQRTIIDLELVKKIVKTQWKRWLWLTRKAITSVKVVTETATPVQMSSW